MLAANTRVAMSDPFASLWPNSDSKIKKTLEDAASQEIDPVSDLSDPNRTIWIITTASLPWMTGTAINPLLRAAYLAKDRPKGKIHLLVPWLEREDQEIAFPPGIRFDHPDEQREYVKNWLTMDAQLPNAANNINITFFSARYHDEYHSIFPMGDVSALIPDDLADVCVLEEPEHLNWYRAPFTAKTWTEKFNHVVGIIHTNYLIYTKSHSLGQLKEPLLYFVNQGMCRAYCHKIIKLSGALQEFAIEKEVISNVHGVRTKYLSIGDRARNPATFTKGAYFIGKLAWPKGLGELYEHMKYIVKRTNKVFPIDIYGQGPHEEEIRDTAHNEGLPVTFFGAKDHSFLSEYKVFVNPSVSEVLCTTIVEAIAMGKWVVCRKHPSNTFFEQFDNCLTYSNDAEFAANIYWALDHDPLPLTDEQRYVLSWEAATERFLEASKMTVEMKVNSNSYTDKFIAWAIDAITQGKNGDYLRQLAGGRAAADQYAWQLTNGLMARPRVQNEEEKERNSDRNEGVEEGVECAVEGTVEGTVEGIVEEEAGAESTPTTEDIQDDIQDIQDLQKRNFSAVPDELMEEVVKSGL